MPDIDAALSAASAVEGASQAPAQTQPTPAPAATPSPTPAPSPAAAPSPAPAPAAAATSPAAAAPGGGQSQGDYISVRDMLRQAQYPGAEQFTDDYAALQALVLRANQAEQMRQMAQYGQLYLQHQPYIQQAIEAQRQRQAAEQAQRQQWFKAPEFDPRWREQIVKDPTTGELRPAPGAPPDVVQRYATWVQHEADFREKMARDPIGTLKPGLEQLVEQKAQAMIQQHLGQYQEQSYAQGFVNENRGWLFQQDAQGQMVRDVAGQPQLSPWGQRFRGYMAEAHQAGIQTEQARANYALRMVRGDYLFYQQQQQASGAANQAGKDRLLQQGLQSAQQQQVVQQQPAGHQPATPIPVVNARRTRSVGDRIREKFAANGIGDAQINATLSR